MIVPRMSRNGIARGIVTLCLLWAMVCLCFGATKAFSTAIGGSVVVNLMNPMAILLAGGSCAILLVNISPKSNASNASRPGVPQRSGWFRKWQLCGLGKGEPDFDYFSAGFVLLPLLIFVVVTTISYFQRFGILSTGMDMIELKIDIVSNILGVMSCYAMGFFFIPVARFSPILIAFDWNPVSAVRIHVWAGTIAFFAAVAHGVMYLLSWKYIADESLIVLLIPSKDCFQELFGWTHDDDNSTVDTAVSLCHSERNCSCSSRLINFTGLLALLTMTIIALTSLTWVRRNYYALFYRVHVIVSPIFFLIMAVHFRFVMIYIGGGMLYYLACSVPVWVEHYFQTPVQLVCIDEITSIQSSTRPLISLTFALTPTAKAQYRPGQYVKLLVPSISPISHPFTVNVLPDDILGDHESQQPLPTTNMNGNHNHQICRMRIIFRATGPFTLALYSKLTSPTVAADSLQTAIYLDGFHGPSHRVEQVLAHDSLLIVGAGVGIAPYLSLLDSLTVSSPLDSAANSSGADGIFVTVPRTIIRVHWVCRERQLVEFILKQTLNKLVAASSACRVEVVIHDTSDTTTTKGSDADKSISLGDHNMELHAHTHYSDSEHSNAIIVPSEDSGLAPQMVAASNIVQAPFSTSIFATGSKSTCTENLPNGLAFLGIGLIGLAMMGSSLKASFTSHGSFSAVWNILSLVLLSIVVGVSILLCFRNKNSRNQQPSWSALNTDCEEDGENESALADENDRKLSTEENIAVVVENRSGRPDFCRVLAEANFDDCKSPGVFFCGPEAMVESLKASVAQTASGRIALYEEKYRM